MAATLKEQVAQKIATVHDRHEDAIGALEGRMWQSDGVKASISTLRSLRGPITTWANKGTDAAEEDRAPGAGGWAGWLKAGDEFLRGIAELQGLASSETLGAITDTAKNVERDAKKMAAKAQRIVRETAATAGAAAGDIVAPTAKALTVPLIAAAVIAIGAVILRFRR